MKMLRKALLLTVGVILAACAHHDAEKVVRLNDDGNIRVTDIRSTHTNGLLVAAATLQNTSSSTETVQYRFAWKAESGFRADAGEGWASQIIYANQSVQIRGVAPNPQITDFSVELSQ